jgi:hypothetical protein
MPDPLARREPTLPAVQQYPANAPVPTTHAQLAKAVHLGVTVLDAKDYAFQEIERRVNKPGRSYPHQRYVEGQAAFTLHTTTVAFDEIYRREMRKIVANQPKERVLVPVPHYEEVRPKGVVHPKGLMGYLFSR